MLKRATNRCNLFYTIAALRQNELKSDVARFATTNQTCLATIQVVVGCEKFLQNVQSGSTFWNKICTCSAFYRHKANLFGSK